LSLPADFTWSIRGSTNICRSSGTTGLLPRTFLLLRKGEPVDEVREYHMMVALGTHLGEVVNKKGTVVTYNGRGFDIPVIYARMMAFGIPAHQWYTQDFRYRFSKTGHRDLIDILADYGAVYPAKPSLNVMARLCGLPGKMGIDGSMVSDYYARGEYTAIREYCLCDVFQTGVVDLRWLLVKGKIDLETYRNTVRAIVKECLKKGGDGEPEHPYLVEAVEKCDIRRLLLGEEL
jgi:predicted PolB exonuclease-like 3'-5' exonuclease